MTPVAREFRLYPTEAQVELLLVHAANVRFVRNVALEHRQGLWKQRGRSIQPFEQMKLLAELRSCTPWLARTPAGVLNQALVVLGHAYDQFFAGVAGYPKFRSRYGTQSFSMPQGARVRRTSAKWGWVTMPGSTVAGLSGADRRLRIRLHRELPASPTGRVTYRREVDGTWWAVVHGREEAVCRRSAPGSAIGVDLGLTVNVALSDGRLLSFDSLTDGEARRLGRLQRRLSRQQPGSRARHDTKLAIGRLHRRAHRRRKDFARKVAADLANHHRVVVFEDLNLRGMSASARGTSEAPGHHVATKADRNRRIREAGWGMVVAETVRQVELRGGRVLFVSPYRSSQTCAACGAVDPASRRDGQFTCTACGVRAHADVNAARVILARGLAQLGGVEAEPAGGSPVDACPEPTSQDHHQLVMAEAPRQGPDDAGTSDQTMTSPSGPGTLRT